MFSQLAERPSRTLINERVCEEVLIFFSLVVVRDVSIS